MRCLSSFLLVYIICLSSYCQTNKGYSGKDVFALNEIVRKWQSAWNTHNMDSMWKMGK
jgi:hypothetical protein